MKTTAKKAPGKAAKAKPKPVDLDLDPDAWPKFEALVRSAAKMGPKPHADQGKRQK